MYKRSESFFSGYDGTQLFLQKWEQQNSAGTILFTHGQAEHSDCYHRLISAFEKRNWSFIGWDMRGHGRSAGLRGYAKDVDEYVLDYQKFFEACSKIPSVTGKPLVLLAHSLGGLVQTCALLDKNLPNVTAQVLSSPLFGVSVPVPAWKDMGSTYLNQILPKLTLGNEIKNTDLTRDPDIIREYEQDTYRHNKISAGVYLGMKREFERLADRGAEIKIPTCLHISDNDPVVSSPAALKFFDGIQNENKSLKIFEGGKHELYNDIVRDDVFNFVANFLVKFEQQGKPS